MHRINTSRSVDCLNHSHCILIYFQIMQCSKQADEDKTRINSDITIYRNKQKQRKKTVFYYVKSKITELYEIKLDRSFYEF